MSTITKDIVIPSKYDIIPIHTSDRETFKDCRRRWDWSSPARRNLIRKVKIHGVVMPLWFGTGIHYALASYYDPVLSQDPEKVFEVWFNTEWNGGLVSFEELEYYADRDPTPDFNSPWITDEHTGLQVRSRYYVKGLSELLPDVDVELFMEHKVLGIGMMRYYKDYAKRNDNFRVVNVEHTFSVPILAPDGRHLFFEDTREMPEWWEGRSSYKAVHARGRQDTIVQENDTGKYGVVEHKTAIRIDEDYFRHIELDEQCTTYLWAAEREAEIYDLEYKEVDFIIYNALRKAYPKPPTITTRGLPSLDKQKESTTAEMFDKCVKDNGLQLIFDSDPKMQAYYLYLLEQGEKQFVMRGAPGFPYVMRNKQQRENAGRRLYYEALDMLDNPHIYLHESKRYQCLNCIFRAPCIAAERGDDYEFMLEDGYQPNYDR